MSRRITGPLIDPTTGTLLADRAVRVETAAAFAGSAATYPRATYDLVTDASGQFDLELATPASGTQAYTFRISGSPPITLNISSGPDTTLHSLIASASSAVDASALQAHADTIASPTVLGHVKVGDGLSIDGDGYLSAEGGPGGGAVESVNGQAGTVVLGAGDVGADPSGTAAGLIATEAGTRASADSTLQANITAEASARATADSTHAALTTSAHGGVVASSDPRLTDSRTPLAHASTHASAGSDPITISEGQVTNLVADLALKAPLANPALTGTPTAPTQADGNSSTRLATTAFVQSAITLLINASPGTLDTLKELADAIGDDPNFATTVATSIATKLAKSANLSDLANAATALTNLGLSANGSSLVTAANYSAMRTLLSLGSLATASSITASLISDASANGRSLITAADYAAMKTLLGLVIGTNVQAWDSDLDAIAALATTSYGRSFLALADAAAARTLTGSVIGTDVLAYNPIATSLAAQSTTTRIETAPRLFAQGATALVSGQVFFSYFTPDQAMLISSFNTITRGTAATAATLAKMGLYSVAGNGDLTCVARCANDTTIWAAGNTLYTRAIVDNGQGGSISSLTLTRGQRYAFAALIITGGTLPQLCSVATNGAMFFNLSPILASASATGQTDMLGTYASGTLSAVAMPWGALT